MKRKICLLLAAAMMLCSLLAIPAGAEETAPPEASAPTTVPETQPPETIAPDPEQAEHSYEGLLYDEAGHWQICTLCGDETNHEAHIAGAETGQCRICRMQTEAAHIHEFASDWNHDAEQHWKECECGHQEEADVHSWDSGREEKDLLIYQCTVCQAEKQEELSDPGFPWWILILAVAVLAVSIGVLVFALAGRRKGNYAR